MAARVLLIGGRGRFGSELASRLSGVDLVLASRSGPFTLDRERDSEDALVSKFSGFTHVIDVAGPFQGVPDFRVARASIRAKCNYIDICDSVEFLLAFSELNDLALQNGVFALTGASTTPAITAAVVRTFGFTRVDTIDTSIHATGGPAGLSVMRAVLSYCGKSVAQFDMGAKRMVTGWRKLQWFEKRLQTDVATGAYRKLSRKSWLTFSLQFSVDPVLFPGLFQARLRCSFRAALDSQIMQIGMSMLSWFSRQSLEFLAPVLNRLQHLFLFGSKNGALYLTVRGTKDGAFKQGRFALRAKLGHGFAIPIVPVLALLHKQIAPGARICCSELTLEEISSTIERHVQHVQVMVEESSCGNVFAGLVGKMSPVCAKFHSPFNDSPVKSGTINVEAGQSWIARIAQMLAGLPTRSKEQASLVVAAERGVDKDGNPFEKWTRYLCSVCSCLLLSFFSKGKSKERALIRC